MTMQQLEDRAYMVATGEYLTECFNVDEFLSINTTDFACEAFEYWDEVSLNRAIIDLASLVIYTFKEFVDETK